MERENKQPAAAAGTITGEDEWERDRAEWRGRVERERESAEEWRERGREERDSRGERD